MTLQKPRLKVEDLMTEKVFTATDHDDLATVYDIMASAHIRHLPVVNRRKDVLGLIAWDDIMQVLLGSASDLPLSTQRDLLAMRRVDEFMCHEPETIEIGEDVAEAGRIMMENKLSCLPVVDGEKLIGILTEEDFVKHVVAEIERSSDRYVA